MRAGALNKKITIQVATETQDALGATLQTWATFASVWASVEPFSGREFFQSQKVATEQSHRVNMRYLAGVSPKMRILYGTRVFEIVSPPINVRERGRELELICNERVT